MSTTGQKIDNLANAIGQLLNSDIENNPDFDPVSQMTALSMVLCNAARMMGINKEHLLHALSVIYDITPDAVTDEEHSTVTQ